MPKRKEVKLPKDRLKPLGASGFQLPGEEQSAWHSKGNCNMLLRVLRFPGVSIVISCNVTYD